MRENDDLGAAGPAFVNLVDSVIPAETVLAAERIVKYDNLTGTVRVLFQLCEKKSESERAFVPGAQCVSKARPIMRRVGIAKINRVLVNHDLIARIWRTAAVIVGRRRDSETRIYALQVVIDALTVGRDDLAGMRVKLLAGLSLRGLKRALFIL